MKIENVEIGASEAAAALGLDAYKTPLMLYSEKVGIAEREPESDAMRIGRYVEHALADAFAAREGVAIERWPTMYDVDVPWLRASCDRVIPFDAMSPAFREKWSVQDGEWLVWEGKTAGLASPRPVHEVQMRWGAPMSDDVPKGYAVQVLMQCRVLDRHLRAMGAGWCTRGIIKAMVAGLGDPEYVINCNPAVQDGIVAGLARFVSDHLVAEVPPDPRTLDDWETWMDERRVQMRSRTMLTVTPELEQLVRVYLFARRMHEIVDVGYAGTKARLCEAIGEAYGVEGPWGRVTYTKGSEGEKLRAEKFAADVISLCTDVAFGASDDSAIDIAKKILRMKDEHTVPRVFGRQLRATVAPSYNPFADANMAPTNITKDVPTAVLTATIEKKKEGEADVTSP